MLCEKSVVQFACRTSVSVSCIWKTNSTGNLGQEMAIEKTILRFLGSRDFSHSMERRDPAPGVNCSEGGQSLSHPRISHRAHSMNSAVWIPAFQAVSKVGDFPT